MRIIAASIVIGSLALIGALPAAAGQSPLSLGSGNAVRIAAGDYSADDRDSYIRRAHDDVQEWQQKLANFGKRTEAAGKHVGNAAQSDLNAAWTKTEAASHRLENAGADGWESAKIAFEDASDDLADTWHRNVPDNK